ncbi:6104_t:CDS:1 [Ambispora gerdemannii]|uniref:6104_t:CDS:1 n=1 Tax=Ambispora gerdemannii TaxID=144530 RepID=A0A9N9BKW2_9GLOM|nr:6104_t:CDS:1 [Ambispora gerdemannii]
MKPTIITLFILHTFLLSATVNTLPLSLEKRQLYTGQGTYYNPGLGACGQYDDDNSAIVALAAPDFDAETPNGNPNRNRLCNRYIRIYYNNRSVEGMVRDRCPECSSGDVDMSPAMFDNLANRNLGRISISWQFI